MTHGSISDDIEYKSAKEWCCLCPTRAAAKNLTSNLMEIRSQVAKVRVCLNLHLEILSNQLVVAAVVSQKNSAPTKNITLKEKTTTVVLTGNFILFTSHPVSFQTGGVIIFRVQLMYDNG